MITYEATTYGAAHCRKFADEVAQSIRHRIINDINLGAAYDSSYGGGEGTGFPKWAAERVGMEVRVVVDGGRGSVYKAVAGIPDSE